MSAQRTPNGQHAEHEGDFAFLALRAAIQLNRELEDREADQQPIRALVEAIKQTPGVGTNLDRMQIAANPKAVSLLSGAFLDARKEEMNTRTILGRITTFLEGIDSPDPTKRRASREEMRDFCFALHSRLLAERFPAKEADTVFGGGLRRLGLC